MESSTQEPTSSDVSTSTPPRGQVTYLRTLSSKAPISREAVELLWRKGLVAGLFNVPTQAVFDACTDFCIESSVAANSQDVVKILESQAHKIDSLSLGLKTAVKKGLDTRLELDSLLERSRDLTSQIVLLEEQKTDDKRKLSAATKSNKDLKRETDAKIGTLEEKIAQLTESLAKSEQEKAVLSSHVKSLTTASQASSEKTSSLLDSKSQLEKTVLELSGRLRTLETSLESSESAKYSLLTSQKRIEALEEENRLLKENAARSSAIEEELQAGLKSLTDAYVLLQEQHNQLSGTASRLQADNFELRNATSSSDQNDTLNQRLLSHYRYLVRLTEDQDSDEGASDSEAWK